MCQFFTLLEVRICNETKQHQQNSPHKQEVKEKIEVPQTTHSHTHTSQTSKWCLVKQQKKKES